MAAPGTQNPARVARFAELMSQDMTPTEAGQRMGLTKGEIANCWRRIKSDLGAQAV